MRNLKFRRRKNMIPSNNLSMIKFLNSLSIAMAKNVFGCKKTNFKFKDQTFHKLKILEDISIVYNLENIKSVNCNFTSLLYYVPYVFTGKKVKKCTVI